MVNSLVYARGTFKQKQLFYAYFVKTKLSLSHERT